MKTRTLFAGILLAIGVSACAPKAEPFFFVQISDTQIGFNDTLRLSPSLDRMAEAVEKINEIKPDFVIMTGDNIHAFRNEEQQAVFDSLRALLEVPIHYLPGNHDERLEWEGSYEEYLQRYGYDRFAFMHKGALFLGVNSNIIKENREDQEAEQYDWMVSNLEKYGKKAAHIVMAMHCPIFKESLDEKDSYSNFQTPYRQKYLDLCDKYGIDLVISGHRHLYHTLKYNGTSFVSCPGCGLNLGGPDLPLSPGNQTGINIVKVTPEAIECLVCASKDAFNPLN